MWRAHRPLVRVDVGAALGAAPVLPASPAAAGDGSIVRTAGGLVEGTVSGIPTG